MPNGHKVKVVGIHSVQVSFFYAADEKPKASEDMIDEKKNQPGRLPCDTPGEPRGQ